MSSPAGKSPALVLLDAAIRLLPGVMGAADSAEEESFSASLLEYPHYTRPAVWADRAVPETLTSGNHQAIAAWRHGQAATHHQNPQTRSVRPIHCIRRQRALNTLATKDLSP